MKRVFLIFQPISSVRRELVWFRPVKSTHSFHFRSTSAVHDVFPGGGQNSDPSPCTTDMDYPKMDHATEALIWCMNRVRKLKESLRFHLEPLYWKN